MIDHDIVAIYSDDPKETFDDFKATLEAIYAEEDGLHTVFFSRYFDYKIITELVYIIKQDGFFIFLESPFSYNVLLNKDLEPELEQYTEAQTFIKLMYSTGNVEHADTLCDDKGNLLYLYSLPDQESINYIKYWKNNFVDCIDTLQTDQLYFEEISLAYLKVRKEKFEQLIQRVIENDEVYEGFDDNPFSHMYYDKEDGV